MAKPLTGIAIIRCQLSEDVCSPEEWKKNIKDNPDFQSFCVKAEEIIVVLTSCKGCQKNKDGANEIKTIASKMIKKGIGTIFLTRCVCRNIRELKSYMGIKGGNLSWINTFESFCKGCIGGLEKEAGNEPCLFYQGKITERCPNSTALQLIEFIKDSYSWVNVIIKN